MPATRVSALFETCQNFGSRRGVAEIGEPIRAWKMGPRPRMNASRTWRRLRKLGLAERLDWDELLDSANF